jgi:hypothetical protein
MVNRYGGRRAASLAMSAMPRNRAGIQLGQTALGVCGRAALHVKSSQRPVGRWQGANSARTVSHHCAWRTVAPWHLSEMARAARPPGISLRDSIGMKSRTSMTGRGGVLSPWLRTPEAGRGALRYRARRTSSTPFSRCPRCEGGKVTAKGSLLVARLSVAALAR